MKRLMLVMIYCIFFILNLLAQGEKTIEFKLFLKDTDDANYILTWPYDMAFDKDESVYILDPREFSILKFDVNGKFIKSFGKKGQGPGEMQFPMSITIEQNDLYVIDLRSAINKFNLYGQFLSSTPKEFLSVQHIKAFPEEYFIGIEYHPDEHGISLGKYAWSGKNTKVIDKIDYRHYFTKDELSTKKNISTISIDTFAYDINSGGEIFYAKSNQYQIIKYTDGGGKVVINEEHKAKKRPNMNGIKKEIKKTAYGEVLLVKGDSYYLVYDLMMDRKDNIWFYTTSEERSGFVKYTADGKFISFYKINLDYLQGKKFYISRDYIYSIYMTDEKVEIYRAAIPK